jgi:hypothetical protein
MASLSTWWKMEIFMYRIGMGIVGVTSGQSFCIDGHLGGRFQNGKGRLIALRSGQEKCLLSDSWH